MKKKITIVAFAVAAIVGMALTASCLKIDSKHCKADAPYWCSSAKVCCAYQYHDGHGTCWETLEGCHRTGYACAACHIEDD